MNGAVRAESNVVDFTITIGERPEVNITDVIAEWGGIGKGGVV